MKVKDERAKVWLDAHMKYRPSDLADLRALLNEVRDDALEEAAGLAETETYSRDRGEFPARRIRARKSSATTGVLR